ncbi:MAG TPA: hypothetical protein VIZ58_01630, partial [Thermoanaerobaculia bacterium]
MRRARRRVHDEVERARVRSCERETSRDVDPGARGAPAPPAAPATPPPGIDRADMDPAANACVNFYQYAAGGWLK